MTADGDVAAEVEEAIKIARAGRQRYSTLPFSGSNLEVYAYPQGEMTCWGCNSDYDSTCFARGIV